MIELTRRGSWQRIREWFTQTVPQGATVYWVTYTLNPSDPLLSFLRMRKYRVRLLCKHPASADDDEYPLTSRAWLRITAELRDAVEIRGVRSTPHEADAEQGRGGGPLHAKLIFAESRSKSWALIGSFNCTKGSLESSMEDVADVPAADLADARRIAYELWEEGTELRIEDCIDPTYEALAEGSEPRHPFVGTILDGPATTGSNHEWRRAAPRVQECEALKYEPALVQQLAVACDRLLKNWPTQGADSQFRIFQDLRATNAAVDVLYLPVGVGKTFIAMRWLLWRIDKARRNGESRPHGVFLCPNEWVECSVARDRDLIEREAHLSQGSSSTVLRIERVSNLDVVKWSQVAGIVLDECHNWNPEERRSGYGRARALTIKNGLPLLGLSATPCRMDRGTFSVAQFISSFVEEHYDTFKPRMTLREAIDEGFLVRPQFEPLEVATNQGTRIREILDHGTVQWGEYGRTTLSEVWEVLDERSKRMAELIADGIEQHSSRRVVVFLPPVGERLDGFVRHLGGMVRRRYGQERFFNFLARETDQADSRAIFDDFRNCSASPGSPAVLVTIDRFAEGVSVPEIDMLVMLRATLSPRVFMQALGRGLRLSRTTRKDRCIVLDAVGVESRFKDFEASLSGEPFSAASLAGNGRSSPIRNGRGVRSPSARNSKATCWGYRIGKDGNHMTAADKESAREIAIERSLVDTLTCYVIRRRADGEWEETSQRYRGGRRV